MFCLALPHYQDLPPKTPQLAPSPLVARDVPSALLGPEAGVRPRDDAAIAAAVQVPEAAVDEDHPAAPGKDEVRPAGQILHVLAEMNAQAAEEAADEKLRLRIRATDGGHVFVTLGGGENIGQGCRSRDATAASKSALIAFTC